MSNQNSLTKVGGNKSLQALIQKRQKRNEVFEEKAFRKKFQGVFTFDVTGSMSRYFETCRENISTIIGQVNEIVPGSQFAVGYFREHGNEISHDKIFDVTDFKENENELYNLISQIQKGGGGFDCRCCVEDCFQKANNLSWFSGEDGKAFVCFVDQYPNGVKGTTKPCAYEVDWEWEVKEFKKKGIKVYPIFAGDNRKIRKFYQNIADMTNGRLLPIDDVHLLVELLVAIAMKETGNLQLYLSQRENAGLLTQETKKTLLLLE